MAQITPQDAADFLLRWREVNRIERVEMRRAPIERRARQLSALFAARRVFQPDPDREARIAEVAARWARIRCSYGE